MALLPLAGSTHVHHLRRASEGRVNGTFALDNTFDGVTDTTPEGVIYIVSGGGGAKLYSVDLKKPLSISQRNTPATTSR